MNKMIGSCGLDCEKCDAYIATINNDNDLRKKTAELWSKLNNIQITPEMINCMGCLTDGVKTYFCSEMCEIRKCAMNHKINTCAKCSKMNNCKIIEEIHKNYQEAEDNLKK